MLRNLVAAIAAVSMYQFVKMFVPIIARYAVDHNWYLGDTTLAIGIVSGYCAAVHTGWRITRCGRRPEIE